MNVHSKRIQELENNDQTLFTMDGDRIVKAYKEIDYFDDDMAAINYILTSGYEYMPSDYEETHDTLDELLVSMAETESDGRKWRTFRYSSNKPYDKSQAACQAAFCVPRDIATDRASTQAV